VTTAQQNVTQTTTKTSHITKLSGPVTTARIILNNLSLLVPVMVVQICHFSKTVYFAHGWSFLSWLARFCLGGPEALMQQPPYRMHTKISNVE
jgi:hypothetical protein